MNIVGLHNDLDAGACLVQDGRVLCAINEERLSRVKLHSGVPRQSLAWVLDFAGLRLEDVDWFVYSWYGKQNDYGNYSRKLVTRVVEALHNDPGCGPILEQRVKVEFDRDQTTREKFEAWLHELGIPQTKVAYYDHHLTHAWSAFATSPFDEALVFTFDGRGDLKSATVSSVSTSKGIKEHDYLLSFDSLGFLYGQMTHYLGFDHNRHEGKVTGLAAMGDPAKTMGLMEQLITWESGTIRANIGLYKPFYTNLGERLMELLKSHTREDLAAAVQQHCETLVLKYMDHWIQELKPSQPVNMCASGGLFANVKLNQRIADRWGGDRFFVFPHMGDGGLMIGGALFHHYRLTGRAKCIFDGVYLGPAYDETDVLGALRAAGSDVVYDRPHDLVQSVVNDLTANRVVGYFDGRMEFGPRALGARSVLFHARDRRANDWLNKRMRRSEFMPFAPVTPIELAAECYKNWTAQDRNSFFMTQTYECLDDFQRRHPAVVHVDGTARPQIVRRDMNPRYYDVVRRYCDATGDRALINTSFNVHEEPIVCSPQDAISSLVRDCVDIVYLGPFRVMKK